MGELRDNMDYGIIESSGNHKRKFKCAFCGEKKTLIIKIIIG